MGNNNLDNKKYKKTFKNESIPKAIKPATWLQGAQVKVNKDGTVDILEDKYQDG